MTRARIIVIGGPTAAGKSALAARVAEACNGELVSADSVQIYRGFDIGSAKPSPDERTRIAHHLVDVCDPLEVYSAARFVADADRAIREIAERGAAPIVVGGTGLYLRSLVAGLFESPSDPGVRAGLRAELDAVGPGVLHRELALVDPVAARTISPNDAVRVVRALEVYRTTGVPVSEHRRGHGLAEQRYEALTVTASRPWSDLDPRIEARVLEMLRLGLVEEVRRLRERGVSPDAPPMKTVGYRQVNEVLDGRADPDALAEAIRVATRRFARRQLTWFRGQTRSRWLNLSDSGADSAMLEAATRFLAGEPVAGPSGPAALGPPFGHDDDTAWRHA